MWIFLLKTSSLQPFRQKQISLLCVWITDGIGAISFILLSRCIYQAEKCDLILWWWNFTLQTERVAVCKTVSLSVCCGRRPQATKPSGLLPFPQTRHMFAVFYFFRLLIYLRKQKVCQPEHFSAYYIYKGLFYVKKESQSDYIMSSQHSWIGSYSRLYIVLQDVL